MTGVPEFQRTPWWETAMVWLRRILRLLEVWADEFSKRAT
jgi:hypothetical protein